MKYATGDRVIVRSDGCDWLATIISHDYGGFYNGQRLYLYKVRFDSDGATVAGIHEAWISKVETTRPALIERLARAIVDGHSPLAVACQYGWTADQQTAFNTLRLVLIAVDTRVEK